MWYEIIRCNVFSLITKYQTVFLHYCPACPSYPANVIQMGQGNLGNLGSNKKMQP